MAADATADSIYVGRALPSEYHLILNSMPQAWFEDSPFLLQMQVARLINEGRYLIAQRGKTLLGGVGWQDDIAYGAFYVKLLFVRDNYQQQAVAARMLRELLAIARDHEARAVFADIPKGSWMLKVMDGIPATREVGYVDDWGEPGVTSIMIEIDLREIERLLRRTETMIAKAEGHTGEDS